MRNRSHAAEGPRGRSSADPRWRCSPPAPRSRAPGAHGRTGGWRGFGWAFGRWGRRGRWGWVGWVGAGGGWGLGGFGPWASLLLPCISCFDVLSFQFVWLVFLFGSSQMPSGLGEKRSMCFGGWFTQGELFPKKRKKGSNPYSKAARTQVPPNLTTEGH